MMLGVILVLKWVGAAIFVGLVLFLALRSTLLKSLAIRRLFGNRYEDGLYSSHVADFLDERRFIRAYKAGESTGSWLGSQLRWRTYVCCWAAEHALSVSGDFVECGVNRGGFSRAIIEYVDFGRLPRTFYLLDTFCGDPDVVAVNRYDYSECYADVRATFSQFPNVVLVKGRIPGTLSQVTSPSIAYLSIDLNNAEPEIAALRFFWPKLVPGSIVILDDYAYSQDYASQKAAMDSLGRELGFSVLTLPTGQGLIVKTDSLRFHLPVDELAISGSPRRR